MLTFVNQQDMIDFGEWPIYIQDILPQERLDITITKNDDESRTFAFQANGAQYQNIVEELKL